MLDLLSEVQLPTLIAVTKVDKLSAARARERVLVIQNFLKLDPDQFVAFSSVTGQGRDELAAAVVQLVAQPAREF
jgi:GTP-binding protein